MVSCKETSSFACSTPNTVTSGGISVSVAAAGVAQVGNGINSLTLSPNPSGGSFTIKGSLRSGADEHVDIAVTDMLGQTVYKETAAVSNGKVNAQLNLSSIVPNGIYLVSVTAGEGHVVFHVVIDK